MGKCGNFKKTIGKHVVMGKSNFDQDVLKHKIWEVLGMFKNLPQLKKFSRIDKIVI